MLKGSFRFKLTLAAFSLAALVFFGVLPSADAILLKYTVTGAAFIDSAALGGGLLGTPELLVPLSGFVVVKHDPPGFPPGAGENVFNLEMTKGKLTGGIHSPADGSVAIPGATVTALIEADPGAPGGGHPATVGEIVPSTGKVKFDMFMDVIVAGAGGPPFDGYFLSDGKLGTPGRQKKNIQTGPPHGGIIGSPPFGPLPINFTLGTSGPDLDLHFWDVSLGGVDSATPGALAFNVVDTGGPVPVIYPSPIFPGLLGSTSPIFRTPEKGCGVVVKCPKN